MEVEINSKRYNVTTLRQLIDAIEAMIDQYFKEMQKHEGKMINRPYKDR